MRQWSFLEASDDCKNRQQPQRSLPAKDMDKSKASMERLVKAAGLIRNRILPGQKVRRMDAAVALLNWHWRGGNKKKVILDR